MNTYLASAFACIVLLVGNTYVADTIYGEVTNIGVIEDSPQEHPYSEVREGINVASDNDTVLVEDSTCSGEKSGNSEIITNRGTLIVPYEEGITLPYFKDRYLRYTSPKLEYVFKAGRGELLAMTSGETPDSLAEVYLEQLAKKYGKVKKTTVGKIAFPVIFSMGTACVVSGIVIALTDVEGAVPMGSIFTVTGGFIDGIGVILSGALNRPEREYNNVLNIADPTDREHAAREALISLAGKGRRDRILLGILSATVSAYHFVYKPCRRVNEASPEHVELTVDPVDYLDYFIGGVWGTVSFTCLSGMFPSEEEKQLRRYLAEGEQSRTADIQLGIDPCKGVRFALVVPF